MKRKTALRWAAAGVLAAACLAAAILVPRHLAARNAAAAEDKTTEAAVLQADAAAAAADALCFSFSDDAIAVTGESGSGYTVGGTTLTISAAGTYQVSGQCSDGAIKIKKGVTGVTLVLAGLDLTSADTAPICCGKNSAGTILAADGTENSLTDAAQNNDDTAPENENAENAVLKCKAGSQVVLDGGGTLIITSHGKHGISSGGADEQDASLRVCTLTLQITTEVGDAIHAGQALTIESGALTLNAADDALHSDVLLTIGAADTDGPAICITGCYEGVEAAQIAICSGDLEITATDDCINAANSQLQGATFEIAISGGRITAYSTSGDGFDSNGTMTITSGDITVWTANTADNQPLDADGAITITGGTVLAAGGSGGMGMQLTTEQPYLLRQGGAAIAAGETLCIADADGTSILDAGQAPCAVSFLFYTSPDLTDGQMYTLQRSGSTSAQLEAQTGALQGGMMQGGPAGGPGAGNGRPDAQPSGGQGGAPAAPADGTPPSGASNGTSA